MSPEVPSVKAIASVWFPFVLKGYMEMKHIMLTLEEMKHIMMAILLAILVLL